MPIQNSVGDVICGGGGAQGSVNGKLYPFASEGRGCFIDDDTILVQLAAGHVLARWRWRESDVPVVVDPPRGANAMAGGGGKWLADGAGYVYGSIPDWYGAALIGVAPDGTIAYYPNAQTGVGLVIVDPDGQVHAYADQIAKPAPQVVSAGVVIWERGAVGRDPLRPARTDAQGIQLVTVDGEDWLVYWAEPLGLVAQRDGATDGYLLGRDTWHYHARNVGGLLRVVWSVTDGEGPNDSRARIVNRTAPRVPLTVVGPPIDPPLPPLPPHPPLPPKDPTMPTAPNKFSVVQAVFAAHPEIDTRVDVVRGRITDYVVVALGGVPWGRKDRDKDPNNNNNSDDALCYRLSDGRFEIYDIINGGDGSAAWDYKGTFADGENGYFREVPGVTDPPVPPLPPGPGTSTPGAQIDVEIAALLKRIAAAETKVAQAEAKIAALEARPVGGGSVSLDGRRIALKSSLGKFICEDRGLMPFGDGSTPLRANRDAAGLYETFTIKEQ